MKRRSDIKSLITTDTIFLLILGILTGSFFFQSLHIKVMAANFPKGVSFLALVMILYLLAEKVISYIGHRETVEGGSEESRVEGQTDPSIKKVHWFVFFIILLSYPVFILLIGFTFSTLVFLVTTATVMGQRWMKSLIFGILCTAVLVVIFQHFFHITLPGGLLLQVLVK